MLNVALKQCPEFSLDKYVNAEQEVKTVMLHKAIYDTFNWFLNEFDDAEFLNDVKSKLNWHC